jgi:hypothetical protein
LKLEEGIIKDENGGRSYELKLEESLMQVETGRKYYTS